MPLLLKGILHWSDTPEVEDNLTSSFIENSANKTLPGLSYSENSLYELVKDFSESFLFLFLYNIYNELSKKKI